MTQTIRGEFIDGVYVISLHLGDVARRFLTTSPAVAGAAAYLLEKAPDPLSLAGRWGEIEPGESGVALDRKVSGTTTMGDLIVAQAEEMQMDDPDGRSHYKPEQR